MKGPRFLRHLVIFSRRHPFWFFAIVATPVVSLYFVLESFSWGVKINNFLSLMLSVEVGIARLIEQDAKLWSIIGLAFASHGANVIIDLFVVRTLLLSPRIQQFIHVLSVLGKELLRFVRDLWKEFIRLVKMAIFTRDRNETPHNEVVVLPNTKPNFVVRFWNHLHDVRKDPTKAGLWTVYVLCLFPRIPTPIGGVGMAIFIVQYNKMGLRGWLVITAGIVCHVAWVVPSAYGFLSFF